MRMRIFLSESKEMLDFYIGESLAEGSPRNFRKYAHKGAEICETVLRYEEDIRMRVEKSQRSRY
jgi:hypothetical protein